jgi:DNA-binding response OmpR family regulator
MPQGDGFELIAALRKDFPTTEIVAVSGGGHVSAENYLMIARGFGVDVVLRKPITRADLVMAVKAVERRALARVSRGPSLN